MNKIKSLEDLKKVREEALRKRELRATSGQIEIVVGMGTVGIAAGARETLKAILDFIESENVSGVVVRQAGNIGLDSFEPVVQVTVGTEPKVTYGKVSPDSAVRIMKEHIVEGNIVKDLVINI